MAHNLPEALIDRIAQYVHELHMVDVRSELNNTNWFQRRLQIVLQHYASQDRIGVTICQGGKVGQLVHVLPDWDQDIDHAFDTSIGCHWNRYDPHQRSWMERIGNTRTDEEWQNYSDWQEADTDGVYRVRLLIQCVPNHPDFQDIESFRKVGTFVQRGYPGFGPVVVLMKSDLLRWVTYPLDSMQLAVKYGFAASASFLAECTSTAYGLGISATHEVFGRIMEHLIDEPAMIIYSPRFREKLCEKITSLEQFFLLHPESREDSFYVYLETLMIAMKGVLLRIVSHPAYRVHLHSV